MRIYPAVFLLLSILFLVACNNEDNSNRNEPTAVLKVVESSIIPGQLELSSNSIAGEGQVFIEHIFTVTNLDTGKVVFGPESITNNFSSSVLKVIPLSESVNDIETIIADFEIALMVINDRGYIDFDTETVSLDVIVNLPEEGSCESFCSAWNDNLTQIICAANTACASADLNDDFYAKAEILNPALAYTPAIVWLQAFGASGGNVSTQGIGGGGGLAQVAFSALSDLTDKNSELYYLIGQQGTDGVTGGSADVVGGSGGSSSIIAMTELDGTDGKNLNKDSIYLVSGGGGGSGTWEKDKFNEDVAGAAGGVVTAINTQSSFSAGSSTTSAVGGSTDSESSGGALGGQAGIGGQGGAGSAANIGWLSDYSLTGNSGNGGYATLGEELGGRGGGGYGGGGLGSYYADSSENLTYADGGGGGGSFATQGTVLDTGLTDYGDGFLGQNGHGEVVVSFKAPFFCQQDVVYGMLINCILSSDPLFNGEVSVSSLVSSASAVMSSVIDADTLATLPLWIQAWGAKGGGTVGGAGGFAHTIIDSTTSLMDSSFYYYIGGPGSTVTLNDSDTSAGSGGAASMVINQVADDELALSDSYVIAGGGGGASADLKSGGDGGSALATINGYVVGSGYPGEDADNAVTGGIGGNEGGGAAGSGNEIGGNGESGVGGLGGALCANYSENTACSYNIPTLFLNSSITFAAGQGGYAASTSSGTLLIGGGAGGGGVGGGGGGAMDGKDYSGGGGGGSYAKEATAISSYAQAVIDNAANDAPSDGSGQVRLVFDLSSLINTDYGCAADDDNDLLVICTVTSSSALDASLDTAELIKQAKLVKYFEDDDTKVWIQAWGAKGGSESGNGSHRGRNGFAQVIYQSATELPTTLYYYVGSAGLELNSSAGTGGASSMVLTSLVDEVTVNGVTNTDKIIVIAGGGGAGSKGGDSGGGGGVAISDISGVSSIVGGNGSGDNHGFGGNSGGNGEAGTEGSAHDGYAAAAGTAGAGGKGGKMYSDIGCSNTEANFLNKQVSITAGKGGHGGIKTLGDSPGCEGGAGGGGYGGGGGGSTGGGGGGGSYAEISTSTSALAPTSLADSEYDDDDGQVRFVFDLSGDLTLN